MGSVRSTGSPLGLEDNLILKVFRDKGKIGRVMVVSCRGRGAEPGGTRQGGGLAGDNKGKQKKNERKTTRKSGGKRRKVETPFGKRKNKEQKMECGNCCKLVHASRRAFVQRPPKVKAIIALFFYLC